MRKLLLIMLFVKPSLALAMPALDGNIASIINYQGIDLPEQAYANGNMENAKVQGANSEIGKIVGTSFTRQSEYKISHKDSFLDKAKHVQANPESYVDWLSGKYEDCKQESGEGIFFKERVTCDEYQELKEQSCHVGRLLEVDAKHNYECLRRRDKFAKVCTKTLNVTVEETQNCDGGNIACTGGGDFKSEYPNIFISPSYGAMTVSSQNTGRGIPHGAVYSSNEPDGFKSTITFQVRDLSLLKELTLDSLSYYCPLEIKVNDTVVFTSSADNPLKVIGKAIGGRDKEFDFGFEDKGKFYTLHHLNNMVVQNIRPSLNILQHVRPGNNTVVFRSLVSKPVAATLRTKQNCKVEVDHWSEVCRERGML